MFMHAMTITRIVFIRYTWIFHPCEDRKYSDKKLKGTSAVTKYLVIWSGRTKYVSIFGPPPPRTVLRKAHAFKNVKAHVIASENTREMCADEKKRPGRLYLRGYNNEKKSHHTTVMFHYHYHQPLIHYCVHLLT